MDMKSTMGYEIDNVTDLAVEEAVEGGDDETLEGSEEVCAVGPDGELPDTPVQGRLCHVEQVRDAQERQQDDRCPHSFPNTSNIISKISSKTSTKISNPYSFIKIGKLRTHNPNLKR